MNTFNLSEKDTKQAEKIRRQYLNKEAVKIEKLKKLDNKVKAPGRVMAYVLGITGSLVMGSGMAMIMEWNNMSAGLALGIPGMIAALTAYPVYSLITNKRKKKYSAEIIHLSGEFTKK